MSKDVADKRVAFRTLHEDGHFVIPSPWDIGGVRRLEELGFKALASISDGYAWSLGRQDGERTRNEALEHLRTLCASTDLPVNADGVRRLSVGFPCAAVAWAGFDEAALSLHDDGHLPAANGANHG
jgi:phosphoenolpyruvate phosphomutase-like protein